MVHESLYLYSTNIAGSESTLVSDKIKNDAFRISERMLKDYIANEIDKTIKCNEQIVLFRCIITYLGMYLLHFKSNKTDHQRVVWLLQSIRHYIPERYPEVLNATTRKIPFVKIFEKFHISSYYLYPLLDLIYRKIHAHPIRHKLPSSCH